MAHPTKSSGRGIVGRVGASLALGTLLITAAGQSAASAANAPVPIVFGEISTAPSHAPLYAAIAQGFFKNEGLDVSLQVLSGGTPSAMAAMATGSLNMMMAGSTEFIDYLGKKVISGKVVGEIQDSTFDIVAAKDITSVPQLKGKTIGISAQNAGDQIFLLAVLQHYGLGPNDVNFLMTGNPVNRLVAMSTGAIQATAESNNNRDASLKIGAIILLKSDDSPVKIPNAMIFANNDLMTNHKDEVAKFLKAMGDATTWVKANPTAAAPLCAKGSGATIQACLDAFKVLSDPSLSGKYTWSSTYALDPAGMASALAVENTLTPETKGLKIDDVIDTSLAAPTP